MIYPDGSNNLPAPPGPRSGKSWAENFVDLKVRRYSVTGGLADIDIRQVPLDFNGEDLRVQMTRDAAAARYRGNVASRRLRIASNIMAPSGSRLRGRVYPRCHAPGAVFACKSSSAVRASILRES